MHIRSNIGTSDLVIQHLIILIVLDMDTYTYTVSFILHTLRRALRIWVSLTRHSTYWHTRYLRFL